MGSVFNTEQGKSIFEEADRRLEGLAEAAMIVRSVLPLKGLIWEKPSLWFMRLRHKGVDGISPSAVKTKKFSNLTIHPSDGNNQVSAMARIRQSIKSLLRTRKQRISYHRIWS